MSRVNQRVRDLAHEVYVALGHPGREGEELEGRGAVEKAEEEADPDDHGDVI